MSIIIILIFAWFLTLFHLDTIIISGLNEVIGTNWSTNVYWLIVVIIAIIAFLFEYIIKNKQKKD